MEVTGGGLLQYSREKNQLVVYDSYWTVEHNRLNQTNFSFQCQKNLELETENHNPKKSEEELYSKKQIITVPRPVFRSEYVQKGNFTEIKAFCAPPRIVKEVMTCFGLLVGIENPYDWVSIKKGLGASNFYKDKLGGFDIDKVDKKTVRTSKSHFKKYVNESVAAIRAKSAAGAEIAKWVSGK